MVRAGAATPKRKEKEAAVAVSAEDRAEETESKRLRDLAFSRSLLSRTRSHALQPSRPSKTILNSDGRDIVKKGHRKSKYLFAFPGLMAPVSGGKLGELTNLDSKNPVLYVDFPQGRLKLFGTIVYPKNKYLTLHFPRGAGNIVCEDCFESLVVFSQAWWIGTKEHNPEEARLPLPRSFEQDKHADIDFTAGAGQPKGHNNTAGNQLDKSQAVAQSAKLDKPDVSESESSDKDTEGRMMSPPVRQSARTSGRKLNYADSSSDNEKENDDSDSVESQQILNTLGKKQLQTPTEVSSKVDMNIGESPGATTTVIVVSDCETPIKGTAEAGTNEKKSLSDFKTPTKADLKSTTEASKTPLKASNRKSSVLKQSRLEAFGHQNPGLMAGHTTTVQETPLMGFKHVVTTSGIKNARRPRKASKEETEGSLLDDAEDDSSEVKDTPSKDRVKRVKREKGASLTKGASTPTVSLFKTSNSSKDGKTKQLKSKKEKKSAMANALKGAASASKGKKYAPKSTKASKKSSDTEEEISESTDVSDDSDEDWLG